MPSSPSRAKRVQVGEAAVQRQLVHLEVAGVQRPGRPAVRIATASASGIEWLTARNSQSNGPRRSRWPSVTSRVYGRMRCSWSLASMKARVSLEPISGMSGFSRSRYGTAPMWSSWPWVRTMRLDVVQAVPDGVEVRQDQVDAGLVLLGEEHAAVDDQQAAAVLEDRHVAADLAEAAERGDPQAALGSAAAGRVQDADDSKTLLTTRATSRQARGAHDVVQLAVVGPFSSVWCAMRREVCVRAVPRRRQDRS